jgi:hypothetical protein
MTIVDRHHALSPMTIAATLARPADDDRALDPSLRATLVARLHSLSPPPRGSRMRLDAYVVEHGDALRSAPFTWSTRAARRSLGTRAARLVASGDELDVLTAVRHEIDRQCDRSLRGLARPGALGAWLAGGSDPRRAECAIEAASWATGLLVLVAPERTGIRVGIADAWFDVPGARTTLHGRRDATSPRLEGRRCGILRCSDGVPGPRAVDGLIVDGIVAGLSAADGVAPARVLGAWPDAGVFLNAELDHEAIRLGARLLEGAARVRRNGPDRALELVAA